jgi:hypothetical protein
MSDTAASLRRKAAHTMKALAASSLGQYQQSACAVGDCGTGLDVCFRGTGTTASMS